MTAPGPCSCGHTVGHAGHCRICHDTVAGVDALEHLRLVHPEHWGGGPERWPDGAPVVVDESLTPEEFRR